MKIGVVVLFSCIGLLSDIALLRFAVSREATPEATPYRGPLWQTTFGSKDHIGDPFVAGAGNPGRNVS